MEEDGGAAQDLVPGIQGCLGSCVIEGDVPGGADRFVTGLVEGTCHHGNTELVGSVGVERDLPAVAARVVDADELPLAVEPVVIVPEEGHAFDPATAGIVAGGGRD